MFLLTQRMTRPNHAAMRGLQDGPSRLHLVGQVYRTSPA